MVKKGYSFTVGIDEEKPRGKSPIEETDKSIQENKKSVEAYSIPNSTIKTINEDSSERRVIAETYVNGILDDKTEYIEQLLKLKRIENISNGHVNGNASSDLDTTSSSDRSSHSDTISQDSFLTSSSHSSIIYHRSNGKKINKAYSFSVTNQNGTKHKSVIIVSKDDQEDIEIDKISNDMGDKMENEGGEISPVFNEDTEVQDDSYHDENDNVKKFEEENRQTRQNKQNGAIKTQSINENSFDITKIPNAESDFLQMNGFTHKTSNGDAFMHHNEKETPDVHIKSTTDGKTKKDDKDKPPDISFFQLVRCFCIKWHVFL